MKMQKFFRKYQKPLMGILGAVLIVGWLVGDAIQNLFTRKPITTLAQTGRYGKITSSDSDMADSITKLIGMLNPGYNWQSPVDSGRLPQPPLDVVDWIVLNKELDGSGLKMTSDAVAAQFDEPTAQEALAVAAHSNRMKKDDLLSAHARAVSLQGLADFTGAGTTPSLAEVRQLGQRTLEKTKINAVVLPAAAFEDEAATFTDEQIAAQYAAAKDNEAGTGLDFGYVLEDAVKIEYIEIDRKVIEQNLKVDAAKVEREAKKYWEENRTAPVFRRPKEEPKPEEKPAADAGAENAPSPATEEKKEPAPDAPQSDAPKSQAPKSDTPAPAPAKPEGGPGGPRAVEPTDVMDGDAGADVSQTTAIAAQEDPSKPAGRPAQKPAPAQPPAETPAPAKPTDSNPTQPGATTQPPSAPGAPAVPPGAPVPPPGATGQPPVAPPIAYFETWEEAKEAAIKQIRQQYTGAKALEITTWLQGRLDEPWIGIKANADGFKPAPDSVKAEGYYANVIEQAGKALGYADALKPGKTELFTRSQASTLPGGLATAMHFETRGMRLSLASLAFNVEGLTKIPEGVDKYLFLSLMQTSRYALTAVTEGKSYLIRVIETRPSRPPQSVDEVRDRVVKDLRTKAAFEAARKKADELLAAAKTSALKDAYDASEELQALKDKNVLFLDPLPFARMTSAFAGDLANRGNVSIAGLGAIKPELADRIFALAAAADHRDVILLEDRASVLVVEWKETLPARVDDFDKFRTQQTARLASIRATAAKREFLRPSNVRARAGVEERK
ncbi:MAG: hypothetical protein IT449_13085 [Phycisphaerales bacterium]|nr:hypothetical protein [Phycisphaerales bacterium]